MDKKNTENKIIKSLFTFDGIKKTDKKSLIKIVSVFIIIFAIFSANTTKLEAAIKLETIAYSNDDTIKVQASVLWGTPVTADKKIVEIIIKDINDNIISSATIPMITKPGTDNNQGGTINMDKLTANTNYKVQVLATQGEGASGSMMPNIINIKTRPAGEKTLVLNGENPVVIINQDKSAPPPNGGVYTLLAPIGDIKTAPDNMGDYFNTIFTLAIGLCGVLAVIMIVIGGVQYMGDESIFGKTEAKSRITSAVLGLLIALGSYALLNTINPDLLGKGGIKINSVSAGIDEVPIISDEGSTAPTKNTFADCSGGTSMVQTKISAYRFCSAYATNLQKMIADASAAGYSLSGGGFRSASEQIALRNKYCPDPKLTVPSSSCKPQVALPGTSNHEQGLAVDLKCNGALINWDDQNPKYTKTPATKVCFDWLTKNAITYGFKNLPEENWHWSIGPNAGH